MPDNKLALQRGYIVDHYRIEEVIGGGGFSFVYLAFHIRTRTKMVIKEYFPHDLVDRLPGGRVRPKDTDSVTAFQMGMKRFFSEGMALSQLKHPNIVNVSNFFRSNGTVFMVMDYEEGSDLRKAITKSRGRLPDKFIMSVFPPVMEGLRALHNASFLHLDIKPANILMRESGDPLLLDFGAVQRVKPGTRFRGIQTLTHGFAAPEQYTEGVMGPWSDVYSLGMTMRACITGKNPPSSLERRQKDTLIKLSKTHARKYNKNLLDAIDWATELDHRHRPPNVDALLRMLMQPDDGSAVGTESRSWFG